MTLQRIKGFCSSCMGLVSWKTVLVSLVVTLLLVFAPAIGLAVLALLLLWYGLKYAGVL